MKFYACNILRICIILQALFILIKQKILQKTCKGFQNTFGMDFAMNYSVE